ncbi:MAG: ATP-grasp domain-containing protein [Thermoanaerobaculia bacterium]|jgi:formate-dependent phosphoribosylglycinamide formyltransferase (GAR transformylase)|nr:ATP-grasp domain-containing protein [Thermoanaerobaculia bacterium]MBP9823476.1 ATP-grasp domain-containing protein [Thermoanaerobaculia bacterium]
MHIVLLGPDLFAAFHDFVRAAKEQGVRVSGIGSTPQSRLRAGLKRHLDAWEQVRNPFDPREVAQAVRRLGNRFSVDRLETVEERLIESAAAAREELGVPGLSLRSARLCRDKPAMKQALREAKIPCAESAAVTSLAALREFAERHGLPLILKPIAGLGSQKTFRVDSVAELERAARSLGVHQGEAAAVEEFVAGHEGFYDTISIAGEPRLEFISHYYPSVLEALSNRAIAPQIAATNRVDVASYEELRELGRKVIRTLGIGTSATHMEWFFGPKGLKISEIGARPPGERIWDLYCVGNDLDLYAAWAKAVVWGRVDAVPSRRMATGSVQVRPERDGRISGYENLDEVLKRIRPWVFAKEVPAAGRETVAIEKGYLANAWFRLRHPDYDELCELMNWIGRTLKVRVR